MHRIFLALAVANGSLLLASTALGFLTSAEPDAPLANWHRLHFLIGLLTALTTLLVHGIAFTYFLGTGRWVKEVVAVYKMPEWIYAQAVRNKRRAFPFEFGGMVLIGAAAWTGGGTDAQGWPAAWHLGASAAALAFNLGAYVLEYAAIVAQARLLLEVKDRADRQREALYATKAAVGDPGPGPDLI